MKNIILLLLIFGANFNLRAQDWNTGGNTTTTFNQLGTLNQVPLNLYTGGTKRGELSESNTIQVHNFFVNQAGFLGLSDQANFFNKGPFSMIHLNGGNGTATPAEFGFRSWMRYGTTITANKDFMYVGIKDDAGLDLTDAVIAWSGNTGGGTIGPDNLVIKFTGFHSFTPANAQNTLDGLEIARFAPNGNVGIGDFSNNGFGLNVQPTHRLDVAGKTRLRDVPVSASPNVLLVGRQMSGVEDNEVQHLSFSGNANEYLNGDGQWTEPEDEGADCDWAWDPIELTLATVTELNGNYPNTECAPAAGKVAIGFNFVKDSKLLVQEDMFGIVDPDIFVGIESILNKYNPDDSGQAYFGVKSTALNFNSRYNVGGRFEGRHAGTVNIGVAGYAYSDVPSGYGITATNIGVYGEASGSLGPDWAGYFVGGVIGTGGVISVSDEMFKDEINDIEGANEIINQLSPKVYYLSQDEYSYLNFDSEQQFGLIAQELEEILPNLVKDVTYPGKNDSLGQPIIEPFQFKGIDYTALIPILIQASKEQNALLDMREVEINELQEELSTVIEQNEADSKKNDDVSREMEEMRVQIDELYSLLSQCCDANGQSVLGSSLGQNNYDHELYQNAPNPFDTYTDISWKMGSEAHASIIVQDIQGRNILTLVDELSSEGLHTVRWDTSNLQPGTYFYSLHVDNELMVKRAIKIRK